MKTLREILKEKGIGQKVVAEALGFDVSVIRRYDDLRKRSVEEVLKISEATGIDFTELTGIKFGDVMDITNNKSAVNMGTVGGHQVNVSGSDYQKIIDKDKIELIKSDANNICLQEVASLKAEISRLEALIKSKDETISAKDVTIEILRNK